MNFADGLHRYTLKRGWATTNPVAAADRPRQSGADPDIRFLNPAELEALIRAVPDDDLGPTEAVLYLAASMTGLRQGEFVALRWQDVDGSSGQGAAQLHARALGHPEEPPVQPRRLEHRLALAGVAVAR